MVAAIREELIIKRTVLKDAAVATLWLRGSEEQGCMLIFLSKRLHISVGPIFESHRQYCGRTGRPVTGRGNWAWD